MIIFSLSLSLDPFKKIPDIWTPPPLIYVSILLLLLVGKCQGIFNFDPYPSDLTTSFMDGPLLHAIVVLFPVPVDHQPNMHIVIEKMDPSHNHILY